MTNDPEEDFRTDRTPLDTEAPAEEDAPVPEDEQDDDETSKEYASEDVQAVGEDVTGDAVVTEAGQP